MLKIILNIWAAIHGHKTYIIGWTSIAFAWVGVGLGHFTSQQAMEMTQIALVGMGLRSGINSTAKAVSSI